MYIEYSEVAPYEFNSVVDRISNIVICCNKHYKGFDKWLHYKVGPGLKEGTRKMFIAVDVADNSIVGITICKKKNNKQKICTLYVTPGYNRSNIGTTLLYKCFDWLDPNIMTFITVSSKVKSKYHHIFYKFNATQVTYLENYYEFGSNEFIYEIPYPSKE